MSTPKVTGRTIIDHNIRIEMGLSLTQYVTVDFYENWVQKKGKYLSPNKGDLYVSTGLSQVPEEIEFLQGIGLLTTNESGHVIPTDKWNNRYANPIEEFWAIHAKGSKATAKQRLPKALKKIDKNTLLAKLKEYIKTNDYQFLKGLDVWLNPDKEPWNDPLVYKNGNKPQTSIGEIFFK